MVASRVLWRVTFPLALVAVLSGCGKPEPEEAAAPPGHPPPAGFYDVDPDTGEVSASITQEDGSIATMRSGEKVPVSLPDGFALYPDAKVLSNTIVARSGQLRALISLESEADPVDMAAFYREQLESAGFAIEVAIDGDEERMIAATGPEDQSFTFHAVRSGGVTRAELMVGHEGG